ncbi:sensor histidine kinase [Colwellia psychrerythraea]|uniref:histidine kinase n=1 Tax=Colwellia psychrerythraea TaxID=28229 RepID=A0A099L347_COLPS|nr:HAMP domain-containing sensor histidine kinase [Colwellia psychrerythraea]KGJ97389.1 integral membrane sensor signal transduction histidine kinase [Colwellia psychrerythraea]
MTNKTSITTNTKVNTKKYHSLSRRIVAQFCIFTLILSCLYGLLSFSLMYDLEDSFIYNAMDDEVKFLIEGYQQQGQWPKPRSNNMQLHFSKDSLPDAVTSALVTQPNRGEFFGENGLYYHLYVLPDFQEVYLLAEVSGMLLVRPMSGSLLKFLLAASFVLMLLACIIAWLLGRKTAKPLQQLADLVDGVAPEHIPDNFSEKFPANEIGILANTLQQTMARIKTALAREKSFTRDVSHELRTPVAIIKNAVEVYQNCQNLDDNTDKKAVAALMKRISDASMQMEQTVVTLLSLAREEQTSIKKTAVNLMALIEQAVIDHSYLLNDKAVEVVVDDNTNSKIYLQQGMLKVLLDNLISNAFQYTDKGQVQISYLDNRLIIADTGAGIEADIADKVTEISVKGSQSTGYGFGLSIVKRLCEHQDWQLKVTSSNNEGTEVSVLFDY